MVLRASVVVLLASLWLGCPGRLEDPERFENAQGIVSADGGGGGSDAGCGATVPADIFQTTCGAAGCHSGSPAAGGLDLASPGVAGRLINQPSHTCSGRVLVTGVDSGFLFEKLEGSPQCGFAMPLGKPPLTAGELACISAWVALQLDGGAP